MLIDLIARRYTLNDAVIVSIIMIFALILHNVTQAWVASRFGDDSPRYQGFLSFEPQNHLEPIGLFFLLLLGFGWPKQINVNSRNYRSRRQEALVWYSGPLAYLAVALLATLVGSIVVGIAGRNGIVVQRSFLLAASVAVYHAVINLFPVFPLDGAKGALALGNPQVRQFVQQIANFGFMGFFIFFFLLSMLGVIGAMTNFFMGIFFAISQGIVGIF